MNIKLDQDKYIKLPCLKSISVKNYSLFLKNWEYELKPGMNLFIGANGLGKTTATNLIIYGIVGYQKGMDNNYFENRLWDEDSSEEIVDESSDPQKEPTLTLKFNIGEHLFTIERNIIQNGINALRIDNATYLNDETDNLNEVYESYLCKYTSIAEVSDIAFLLQYFLIRIEEGNYLLWADKGGDQAKLIRLLMNHAGFEAEYNKLSKEVREWDTKTRGTVDVKKQWQKRLDALQLQREEQLKEGKLYNAKRELEVHLKAVQGDLGEMKKMYSLSLRHIEEQKQKLRELNDKIAEISMEYDDKEDLATTLENKLFRYVYSNEKVLTAIHKLKHYNRCIFCGNMPKEDIKGSIVDSVELRCQCPVCNSSIDGTKDGHLDDKQTIAELEILRKDLKEAKIKMDDLRAQRKTCKKELEGLFESEKELLSRINAKIVEEYDLSFQLSKMGENPEELTTKYDNDIRTIEKEIIKYEKEIVPYKAKFDKALKKLKKKNDKQTELMDKFESDLNKIFKKYTSKFFKKDCVLVSTNLKPKESKVKVKSYIPNFDGTDRYDSRTCSTSQRIFLEYLFRLSLMELYTELSGNKGFLILETSEGAFDIANTKQLAGSFVEFGKNKISFIVVSNFSKKDFIEEIANGLGSSRKRRVLNFVNFGRLTDIQDKDSHKFTRIMKDTGLE